MINFIICDDNKYVRDINEKVVNVKSFGENNRKS